MWTSLFLPFDSKDFQSLVEIPYLFFKPRNWEKEGEKFPE